MHFKLLKDFETVIYILIKQRCCTGSINTLQNIYKNKHIIMIIMLRMGDLKVALDMMPWCS